MNDFILTYEDPESPTFVDPYVCETPGCDKKATVEWLAREDGDLYYSFRCDDHGLENTEYERAE